MKKYEELHTLIRSLSTNEKRNFKIMTKTMGRNSNYQLLFNAVDKQDRYDEAEIRHKFKGQGFIKQLHVTKNYLANLILKSLRQANTISSKNIEARNILSNIEVLYSKTLYKHCENEIKRAEKLCRSYELDPMLIEVLNWKRKIFQALQPGNISLIQRIISEEDQITNRLVNTFQHRELMVEVSKQGFGSGPINPVESKLLKSEKSAISFQAKVQYYHSVYHVNVLAGENWKAEETMQKLLKFLEKNSEMTRLDPGLYISSINNMIAYYVFQKRPEEALELIQHARQKYQDWDLDQRNLAVFRQMLRTYNIELEIFRDSPEKATNNSIIEKVESLLQDSQYPMPQEYMILFHFQLASIYFNSEDYSSALKWINEHLNSRSKDSRPDLEIYIRILNLMIHLELNNLFVLGYFIESTKRYLVKMKSYDTWMKVLMRFFSRMRNKPEGEMKLEFDNLYSTFFPASSAPLISNEVLDFIDLKSWIKAKISPQV